MLSRSRPQLWRLRGPPPFWGTLPRTPNRRPSADKWGVPPRPSRRSILRRVAAKNGGKGPVYDNGGGEFRVRLTFEGKRRTMGAPPLREA